MVPEHDQRELLPAFEPHPSPPEVTLELSPVRKDELSTPVNGDAKLLEQRPWQHGVCRPRIDECLDRLEPVARRALRPPAAPRRSPCGGYTYRSLTPIVALPAASSSISLWTRAQARSRPSFPIVGLPPANPVPLPDRATSRGLDRPVSRSAVCVGASEMQVLRTWRLRAPTSRIAVPASPSARTAAVASRDAAIIWMNCSSPAIWRHSLIRGRASSGRPSMTLASTTLHSWTERRSRPSFPEQLRRFLEQRHCAFIVTLEKRDPAEVSDRSCSVSPSRMGRLHGFLEQPRSRFVVPVCTLQPRRARATPERLRRSLQSLERGRGSPRRSAYARSSVTLQRARSRTPPRALSSPWR